LKVQRKRRIYAEDKEDTEFAEKREEANGEVPEPWNTWRHFLGFAE